MSYADASTYFPYRNSIQKKVLDFFKANPDEELSSSDIAAKFDEASSTAAAEKMKQLVSMNLLAVSRKNRTLHFTAGRGFSEWVNTPEPPRIPVKPVKTPPIRLRLTVVVHDAGTEQQRIEVKL